MEDQEERIYITANSYDDYRTWLTAGDLTQSSICGYDNDLAYDLEVPPSEVRRPWLNTFSFIQSRAVGWS